VAKRILASFPDYGKAPPEYVLAMAEYLAYVTDSERELLLHPRLGVRARCKFLPTVADCEELLREHEARRRQFEPLPSQWKRLNSEPELDGWEPDPEKRRAAVARILGQGEA
jgi:hypothetical protein